MDEWFQCSEPVLPPPPTDLGQDLGRVSGERSVHCVGDITAPIWGGGVEEDPLSSIEVRPSVAWLPSTVDTEAILDLSECPLDRGDNCLPHDSVSHIDNTLQSFTFVGDARDVSEVEHLTWSEVNDVDKGDGHGANWCRHSLSYLAH